MTELTQLLLVLQQSKSCAHDLADIVETAGFELLPDELFEMIAEGDAGRHDGGETINR